MRQLTKGGKLTDNSRCQILRLVGRRKEFRFYSEGNIGRFRIGTFHVLDATWPF